MELIEIEADAPDLIPVKLVGVQYLINPPKAALTMNMADTFSGVKIEKIPEGATDEQKQIASDKVREASKKTRAALDSWIVQAFGLDTSREIQARLLDPSDQLDIKHLMNLMNKVAEATSENPTM